MFLACVATVSAGFGRKERDFWYFAHAENGERAKNEPHRNACYAGYNVSQDETKFTVPQAVLLKVSRVKQSRFILEHSK